MRSVCIQSECEKILTRKKNSDCRHVSCSDSQHSFSEHKLNCLLIKYFYCGITKWGLSWKTACTIILANSTKWVCCHLFGCGKTNFESLARGKFQHVMCITSLLLVTVGQMDPHITNWVTKCAQGSLNWQPPNLNVTP